MLLKNFGVTRHGREVFYDYDEIVPLTDCRFRRIPPPRSDLEEMSAEYQSIVFLALYIPNLHIVAGSKVDISGLPLPEDNSKTSLRKTP